MKTLEKYNRISNFSVFIEKSTVLNYLENNKTNSLKKHVQQKPKNKLLVKSVLKIRIHINALKRRK